MLPTVSFESKADLIMLKSVNSGLELASPPLAVAQG